MADKRYLVQVECVMRFYVPVGAETPEDAKSKYHCFHAPSIEERITDVVDSDSFESKVVDVQEYEGS